MDQFEVTILQAPNSFTNFKLLTEGVGIFTILFVLSILITSLIKRRTHGNQLISVKNAQGFATAYCVIILGTAIFSAILQPIALIKLAGAAFFISSFLLICFLSATCSWIYGAWQGRHERAQLYTLDAAVALLALIAFVLSWM